MNVPQKMFHDFFMKMVQDGKENEAEALLTECFQKQAEGTFDVGFLQSTMPKFFAIIKPECTEQLKKAMESFASKL